MPIKAPTSKKKPAPRKKRTLKSVAQNITQKKRKKIVEDISGKIPNKEEREENGKGVGRPTVIDELMLKKLELCFMVGMSDREACAFCEISNQSLYNYQKQHPEFIEQKCVWKNKITLQAKINIGKSIKDGEITDSKWWLERKARSEFGNRVGIVDEGDLKDSENEEDEEMYKLILSRKKHNATRAN